MVGASVPSAFNLRPLENPQKIGRLRKCLIFLSEVAQFKWTNHVPDDIVLCDVDLSLIAASPRTDASNNQIEDGNGTTNKFS